MCCEKELSFSVPPRRSVFREERLNVRRSVEVGVTDETYGTGYRTVGQAESPSQKFSNLTFDPSVWRFSSRSYQTEVL